MAGNTRLCIRRQAAALARMEQGSPKTPHPDNSVDDSFGLTLAARLT
ncbi:hypothetical protein GCM10027093_04300 [Paraburkholderia jirisanensis]